MRRALIGQPDGSPAWGLRSGGAFHKAQHAALQGRDLVGLTRDDIGQVLDLPGQMSDAFFEVLHEGVLRLRAQGAGRMHAGD